MGLAGLTLVKPSLQELRELVGAVDSFEKEKSTFSLYPDGFPKGSLIEMSGHGKTEFIAGFLKEHPEYSVAWIEEKISINPYALKQRGVALDKILFIETEKEMSWCTLQALHSGCFQVLISNEKRCEEKSLRRYQLLSEKAQIHFFLLSEKMRSSWVPQLQLEIMQENGGLSVYPLRKRGHG